jgi:transcriptional regulator with XRE-family HTH domain
VRFTAEQRERIVRHRMGELGIDTVAELARRAGVDDSALARFLKGEEAVLSAGARARVADALEVEQEELALLYGCATIAVPLDAWRALVGYGDDVERRREEQEQARERREREPKVVVPGPRPRW